VGETRICASALVWNRTSVSCSSGRRHHQIGYKGMLWPGWSPATGIVDYSVVRELLRCAMKNSFGDEGSNLDLQGQGLPACH
jgi:hypothetical protein